MSSCIIKKNMLWTKIEILSRAYWNNGHIAIDLKV